MNWIGLALKVPMIIQGAVSIVNSVKNASGKEKKAAVLAAIPNAVELAEFAAEKDLLNDDAIGQLISAAIDAEAAALKAREALKAGILAKAPAA